MEKTKTIVFIQSEMNTISMVEPLICMEEIKEIIVINLEENKTQNTKMPLHSNKITYGTFEDCARSDIVIIACHLVLPLYQTKLQFAKENALYIKRVTQQVVQSGFQGIFVVASQPVDYMTYVVERVSHFPSKKVIGTGNVFYSMILQNRLSKLLKVSPLDIHAYLLGEQGQLSLIPWSNTYVGYMSIDDYLDSHAISQCQLENIEKDIKESTYQMIENEHFIYEEVTQSIVKIIKAIVYDEKMILCVSCKQKGHVYYSMPVIINQDGIKEHLKMTLEEKENDKLKRIHHQLFQIIDTLINPELER